MQSVKAFGPDLGEPPPPPLPQTTMQQGTLRRQQDNHQRDGGGGVEMASLGSTSPSPYQLGSAIGDNDCQLGVNNCLSQSPHLDAANTFPMASRGTSGVGGGNNNVNSSSSNINRSSSGGGLENKFSMNLIKFPHHHNNLLEAAGAEHDEQPHLYSNQQQAQPQLSYSGLSEAMHNKNFKLDSDRTDISASLAHFNAPLQHPAVLRHAANNNAVLHHPHHHHHHLPHHAHSRFDEVDEDGGELGGLHLSSSSSSTMDEGDKKFNQLQELENSLLMQNLQSNFLKKLDTGYSASNPDYRSLNRRSGFIDTSGANANAGNYPAAAANSSSASTASNPFQRMLTTATTNAAANKGSAGAAVSNNAGNNNFHVMNPSSSSQSIRNTTRSHIITDTLPGPESCV